MRAIALLFVPLTLALLALSACTSTSSSNTTYATAQTVDPDLAPSNTANDSAAPGFY